MEKIKALCVIVGGYFSAKLGMLAPIVLALLLSMVGDYISGMIRAGYRHELNSRQGIWGIVKKLMYIQVVAIAMGADWLILYLGREVGIVFPISTLFGALVTVWLVINEWISILENVIDVVGVERIPSFILPLVKRLKTVVEEKAGDAVEAVEAGNEQE